MIASALSLIPPLSSRSSHSAALITFVLCKAQSCALFVCAHVFIRAYVHIRTGTNDRSLFMLKQRLLILKQMGWVSDKEGLVAAEIQSVRYFVATKQYSKSILQFAKGNAVWLEYIAFVREEI